MAGPKISVTADVRGIQAELAKVEVSAKKINDALSSGEVGLDVKQAKHDLATLQKAAEGLAESLDKASDAGSLDGIKATEAAKALDEAAKAAESLEAVLDAIGQSTGLSGAIRSSREMANSIKQATRAQEVFHREGIRLSRDHVQNYDKLRTSGARGTARIRDMPIDEWASGGWQQHSISRSENARRRRDILDNIGVSGFGENEGEKGVRMAKVGRFAGSLLGGAVGAAEGGGFGFGAMAGGLAGAIPGPAGLILGPVAGAIGAAIDQGIGRARDEWSDYSQIRRGAGLGSGSFDMIKGEVRDKTDGIGILYNEAAKLAKEFAQVTNSATGLGDELNNAVGFARGYGASNSISTRFFAEARHSGVAGDEKGSRRLGLEIATAVKSGGIGGRMDEVLNILADWTKTTTAKNLSTPATTDFAAWLGAATSTKIKGLSGDPGNAAAIIGTVDAAFRNMDGIERTNMLAAYQRSGIDAGDALAMFEGGAFASPSSVYSRDSGFQRDAEAMPEGEAKRRRLAQLERMRSDKTTNLDRLLDDWEKRTAGISDRNLAVDQIGLGLSHTEKFALLETRRKYGSVSGAMAEMRSMGLDSSSATAGGQMRAASVMGLGLSDLKKYRDEVMKSNLISDADKKALAGADDGSLKKELAKALLNSSEDKDPAQTAADAQTDIKNNTQKLAEQLIPLTTGIAQGIAAIAQKIAPNSDYSKTIEAGKGAATFLRNGGRKGVFGETIPMTDQDRQEAIADMQKAAGAGLLSGEDSKLLGELTSSKATGQSKLPTVEDVIGPGSKSIGAVANGKGLKSSRLSREQLSALESVAKKHGIPVSLLKSVLDLEASGANSISPAGALGEFQIMPGNYKGTGLDPTVFAEGAELSARVLKDGWARSGGNIEATLAHYNGGNAARKKVMAGELPPSAETRNYLSRARNLQYLNESSDKMSLDAAKASSARSEKQSLSLSHTGRVVIVNEHGRQIGEAPLETSFSSPKAGY